MIALFSFRRTFATLALLIPPWATALWPGKVARYLTQASILLDRENSSGARDAVRRAIELIPALDIRDNRRVPPPASDGFLRVTLDASAVREGRAADYVKLGEVLERLGDKHNAETAFTAATTCAPRHGGIRYRFSRLLRIHGEYRRAVDEIDAAVMLCPWMAHYRRFRRILLGELSVYRQYKRPSLVGRPELSTRPGRVLHVIENSLPHKTSGYTYRTQYVLRGQIEQGLTPIVVTRPGFPDKYGRGTTFGLARPAYCERVAGIVHHRAPASYSLFGELEPLDNYLQRYAQCVVDVALREQVEFVQAATDFKNGIAAYSAARHLGIPWVYEVRRVVGGDSCLERNNRRGGPRAIDI